MFHFLFPSDPFEPRHPDEAFAAQWEVFRSEGFSISLLSDEVLAGERSLRGVPAGYQVVYRGWMLKPGEYGRLVEAIAQTGASALTSPEHYLAAHYLPNWYSQLIDFTPETRVFPADVNLAEELPQLGWDEYFLKDYVKSLKTSRGSIVRSVDDAASVVEEMRQFRGEIEGGLCVRRVEEFVKESERRYFILNGKPHASNGVEVPSIVSECARRIECPFFSIDIIARTDGKLRVVEIGDGQVSDLVGWSPDEFARIWPRVA